MGQLDDGGIVVAVLAECFYDQLEIAYVAERRRNRGAIKIGTERQMVDPDAIDNVIGVTNDLG